jgi:alkylation response protein AidB-like acyl-CoA dehydrogenase
MKFGLSEEQSFLQTTVNKFLTDQAPLAGVREIAAGAASDTEIWQGLAQLGVPGIMIPEALGGVGLGSLDAAVIAECLGYHVTPGPFITSATMAPVPLMAAGKEELLAAIACGEHRVGIAFGEAIGARNDAGVSVEAGMMTGKSIFVLDGDADSYLIATPDKTIYWVNAGDIKRTALTTVDKTRSTCELVFENTAVELICDDEEIYNRTVDMGRVMQAADTLGAAQSMLNQSVAYAKERKQFNRVIGSFQAVKHMCADMAADLEPCRSMIWYAAHALDDIPEEARLVACHAKAHLSEVGKAVSKTATEVHGGMGFTDLLGLHYWFKRIGANRQLLGSPELLREEAARIQGLVT